MAWPENPPYRYALDNQSWAYCIFPGYPVSALTSADRFRTIQTATVNNQVIEGYDIDEDKDNVWLEGNGQMALALRLAGMQTEASFYLREMEKVMLASTVHENSSGFAYAARIGTGYGSEPLWTGADTKIAISGGAWYLFAKNGFNPFAAGRMKDIPAEAKFWLK